MQQKKIDEFNAKLEEQFNRDRKNRELAAAKSDEASKKEAEAEKVITEKLVETEVAIATKVALAE